MAAAELWRELDDAEVGVRMHALARELYPICRSITGEGVRATLRRLQQEIPLQVTEVPSGTQVFDWTVPKEWNVRDAYIKDAAGRKVVDFKHSNLHLVSYSVPVRERMTLAKLRPHLHSLPERPDWVPYRTSYYNEDWGFCLTHRALEALAGGEYEVVIDSALSDGSLTYAECVLPGESDEEVLFFTHICHPSLGNDNLSGIALCTALAKALAGVKRRYRYRFLFAPATIGSITWLSRNESLLPRIKHGLVVAVVGDTGQLTYKKSRFGDAEIDRAVGHVLKTSGQPYEILEFSPYGYDERQFGSPGIALPIGRLTRTPNGCYPEYHTSADNLELINAESLADSYRNYLQIIDVLEHNRPYVNLAPKCEPQLGRRGLYRKMGGYQDIGQYQWAMLWVLNQSDGVQSLLDIAMRAELPFAAVRAAATDLLAAGLIAPEAA